LGPNGQGAWFSTRNECNSRSRDLICAIAGGSARRLKTTAPIDRHCVYCPNRDRSVSRMANNKMPEPADGLRANTHKIITVSVKQANGTNASGFASEFAPGGGVMGEPRLRSKNEYAATVTTTRAVISDTMLKKIRRVCFHSYCRMYRIP